MPKITIPTVGTLLTLSKPWTFALYPERRNHTVWDILVGEMPCWHEAYIRTRLSAFVAVTLPKGTVLAVDRIYIRQKMDDFDSVSFRIRECPANPKLAKKRFWAKLKDVNRVDGTWDESTLPRRDGPPVLPDEIVIPWGEINMFRDTIPDDLRAALYEQIRLGNANRTRVFSAKLIRGKVYVYETVGDTEVEIFREGE